MVFLRFSSRPRDPLRTFGWSALENSWFCAIFKSLARPSAEFRAVESLPLWRGAHFLEAANLKRFRASGICARAFLARAPNRGRAIGIALKTRGFFAIFNSPARPSAEFGLVVLRKTRGFSNFTSLARPSAEFRAVESLSLWGGAHFDEAARPKPLPSQWDLRQRKLAASSKPSPSHGNCF